MENIIDDVDYDFNEAFSDNEGDMEVEDDADKARIVVISYILNSKKENDLKIIFF